MNHERWNVAVFVFGLTGSIKEAAEGAGCHESLLYRAMADYKQGKKDSSRYLWGEVLTKLRSGEWGPESGRKFKSK